MHLDRFGVEGVVYHCLALAISRDCVALTTSLVVDPAFYLDVGLANPVVMIVVRVDFYLPDPKTNLPHAVLRSRRNATCLAPLSLFLSFPACCGRAPMAQLDVRSTLETNHIIRIQMLIF